MFECLIVLAERTSRPETAASKAAALRSSMNAALLAASIRTTQQVDLLFIFTHF